MAIFVEQNVLINCKSSKLIDFSNQVESILYLCGLPLLQHEVKVARTAALYFCFSKEKQIVTIILIRPNVRQG